MQKLIYIPFLILIAACAHQPAKEFPVQNKIRINGAPKQIAEVDPTTGDIQYYDGNGDDAVRALIGYLKVMEQKYLSEIEALKPKPKEEPKDLNAMKDGKKPEDTVIQDKIIDGKDSIKIDENSVRVDGKKLRPKDIEKLPNWKK